MLFSFDFSVVKIQDLTPPGNNYKSEIRVSAKYEAVPDSRVVIENEITKSGNYIHC